MGLISMKPTTKHEVNHRLNLMINLTSNEMALIGAWPSLTSTMGIKTTDFISLLMNSGMQMFSPDGEKIWLTTTLEKRFILILNCLFADSRNQRSRDACDTLVTSVLKFISKISGRSDLYTTTVFCGRLG